MKIETTFIPLVLAEPPEGITRVSQQAARSRDLSADTVATAIYSLASSVSASVFAAWLYDRIKKVKDKPQFRIRVNEKEVTELSEESFKRTIGREVEIENR